MKTQVTNFAKGALLIIVLLGLPSFKMNGVNKDKKAKQKHCLEVSGTLEGDRTDNEKNVTVNLVEENDVTRTLTVKPNEVFSFRLVPGKQYSIKISRPGYKTRLVCISTALPEVAGNQLYRFHFDLHELIHDKDINAEQEDVLDFPVALICYHEDKGYFDYSEQYTKFIKKAYQHAKMKNATK